MTDRAWLTVYATLADAFILSQPYDAEGAFTLLHALDTALDGRELRGALDASRRLIAALDGQYREAARASMIRLAREFDLLRRAKA